MIGFLFYLFFLDYGIGNAAEVSMEMWVTAQAAQSSPVSIFGQAGGENPLGSSRATWDAFYQCVVHIIATHTERSPPGSPSPVPLSFIYIQNVPRTKALIAKTYSDVTSVYAKLMELFPIQN